GRAELRRLRASARGNLQRGLRGRHSTDWPRSPRALKHPSRLVYRIRFFLSAVMQLARALRATVAPYVPHQRQIEDITMTDSLLAALLLIVAVAPARANDAAPRYTAPSGTVGCVSPVSVLHYSDAVENGDGRIAQRLLNGPCRAIDGAPYELLDDHNGTV